ncbi:MAG: hypothetical protein AAF802_23165, partial [Planctomycetota bacterium]
MNHVSPNLSVFGITTFRDAYGLQPIKGLDARTMAFGLAILLLLPTGCRTKAPIHVWRAPVLQSTVGATVLVPAISGPKDVSSGIQRQLIATAPS